MGETPVQEVGRTIGQVVRDYDTAMGMISVARSRTGGDDTDVERREVRIARVAAMRLQAEILRLQTLALCANEFGVVYDTHGRVLTNQDEIAEALVRTHRYSGSEEP